MSFADLQGFLEGLGFETAVKPNGILFRHVPTETLLVFRTYQPRELVTAADLAVARKMLDERGILDAENFDSQLTKTSARVG